jgi:hypothetical protein
MGLWNLTAKLNYFEEALKLAKENISSDLPKGAGLVAQMCLAKEKIRNDENPASKILDTFINTSKDKNFNTPRYICGAILSLYANSPESYYTYQGNILKNIDKNNSFLWSSMNALKNRYNQFRILKPNSTRVDRSWTRSHIVHHNINKKYDTLNGLELKTLNGNTHVIGKDNDNKLSLLLFIEPPSDPSADFPIVKDRSGKPTENDLIRQVVKLASSLSNKHLNKRVQVYIAFISDNKKQINYLINKNKWTACKPLIIPKGLKNPLINRLGILSADRMPNVYLLKSDGRIVWNTCGQVYKSEFGYPFAVHLAMKVHIEVCEIHAGIKALLQSDYSSALKYFSGPFEVERPYRYHWLPVQLHGKTLALIGQKKWDAALAAINKTIDAQKIRYWSRRELGRRHRDIKMWREDAQKVNINKNSNTLKILWETKAHILKNLDNKAQANLYLEKANAEIEIEHNYLYFQVHNILNNYFLGSLKKVN